MQQILDFLQTGELMGHKSLAMMQRYQHIEDKTSKENIEKIGDEILSDIDTHLQLINNKNLFSLFKRNIMIVSQKSKFLSRKRFFVL